MKLRILKDPQGNIVATSEIKYDLSPELTPKEQEGYTLEEVDVDDDYKSDLNSFYKKGAKK
jgi:hypothetical protein